MSKVSDWYKNNVDDSVSSSLGELVSRIVFMIWTSPYEILMPLISYFNNLKFKRLLLLVWLVEASIVIVLVLIVNLISEDFSTTEWFLGIILVSLALMILNKIVKVDSKNLNESKPEYHAEVDTQQKSSSEINLEALSDDDLSDDLSKNKSAEELEKISSEFVEGILDELESTNSSINESNSSNNQGLSEADTEEIMAKLNEQLKNLENNCNDDSNDDENSALWDTDD